MARFGDLGGFMASPWGFEPLPQTDVTPRNLSTISAKHETSRTLRLASVFGLLPAFVVFVWATVGQWAGGAA